MKQAIFLLYVFPAFLSMVQFICVYFRPRDAYSSTMNFYRKAYELSDWYCKPIGLDFKTWYFGNAVLWSITPIGNLYSYYRATGASSHWLYTRTLKGMTYKRYSIINQREGAKNAARAR